MSSRPYVGQRVDVYYAAGSGPAGSGPEVVFARDEQLGELARLYLALIPLVMVAVGSVGWLLGFLIERLESRSTDTDSWWRRSPLLADLQRRGAIWLLVGLGAFVGYQLVVRYVLGSAGVA